jgi:tetratricopeptide (TPR) repeat protein
MKKILLTSIAIITASAMQAQFKLPAASPRQKVMQEFAAGSIEVNYCRPSMKGRKIFGSLEKYGEVWRTGANEATTVRFTEAVVIANQKLDSGTYAMFTIPNATEWVVIFNKGVNGWGAYDYKKDEDVVRISIKPNMIKPALELFTIDFRDIKKDAISMRLAWENTEVVLPITMDLKSVLKAKLDKAMDGEKKPYAKAAQYYNEIANDPKTALDMCDKGAEANPKDAYKVLYYKIKVLDQMGNTSEARSTADKALTSATEAKDTDYADAIKELITDMNKVKAPVKPSKK